MIKKACLGILEELKKGKIKDQDSFNTLKIRIGKKYGLKEILTNIKILCYLSKKDVEKFKGILITKPSRTSSGVTVVAIMSKPKKCEHGKCIYCPGGPGSVFGDMPQSYTGSEPATMRGIRNKFDSYLQVFNRLEHYVLMNHDISKVELIIMGGTFMSFDRKYRDEFVGYAFKALNDFSKMFFDKEFNLEKFKKFFELPGEVDDKKRTLRIQEKLLKLKGKVELEKEQLKNENGNVRCVALCIETRPDYCKKEHINQMLRLGCTRVELGVQSIYDDILKKIDRGHNVKEVIKATQLLRDSFLKVVYHIMPGLPGSNKERDIDMFKEIFAKEDFMPDGLKIYPCMVVRGTKLYELWKQNKYNPVNVKQATKIIIESKKFIPEFCRVFRIQRDIPSEVIESGVNLTNLRQHIHEIMKKEKIKCRCIRCREPRTEKINVKNIRILRRDYKASNGVEIFLSAEDIKNDFLLGFCRLRIPYKPFRKEIKNTCSGIRELHVYGSSVKVGERGKIQHKGLGKKLVKEAEKIAKQEFGIKKMFILSGIGVKNYYINKLNYKKDGVYVSKKI